MDFLLSSLIHFHIVLCLPQIDHFRSGSISRGISWYATVYFTNLSTTCIVHRRCTKSSFLSYKIWARNCIGSLLDIFITKLLYLFIFCILHYFIVLFPSNHLVLSCLMKTCVSPSLISSKLLRKRIRNFW